MARIRSATGLGLVHFAVHITRDTQLKKTIGIYPALRTPWHHMLYNALSLTHLEMLLPETELDLLYSRLFAGLLNVSRCHIWTTEVDTNIGPAAPVKTCDIRLVENTFTHCNEQAIEVGTTKVGST